MFTPPASPAPKRIRREPQTAHPRDPSPATPSSSSSLSPSPASTPPFTPGSSPAQPKQLSGEELYHLPAASKRRTGHRTRWTILLVPVVLVLVTVSTRYLSHPTAFDALSPDQSSQDWTTWAATISNWQPHKRHPEPDFQAPAETESLSFSISSSLAMSPSSTGSSATASPSSSASHSPVYPTIPVVPPVLPTPFPQPLDTTLSQNFSTESCQEFFVNMTQTETFRECRSFGMLLQSSSAFIQAQSNITLLNTIVWGTCNTDVSEDQCTANIDWFAETMQASCVTELKLNNVMATTTLQGLQSYAMMRRAGCLSNSTTDTYCYVDAVAGGNAANMYLYLLPQGSPLPNSSVPSCTRCTQMLMGEYVSYIGNVTGLEETYEHAAEIANAACGQGFVQEIATVTNKNAATPVWSATLWAIMALLVAMTGTLAS
ncbi:hypothetical protein BKA93DRAFT_820020 [Sparassis latifolia]